MCGDWLFKFSMNRSYLYFVFLRCCTRGYLFLVGRKMFRWWTSWIFVLDLWMVCMIDHAQRCRGLLLFLIQHLSSHSEFFWFFFAVSYWMAVWLHFPPDVYVTCSFSWSSHGYISWCRSGVGWTKVLMRLVPLCGDLLICTPDCIVSKKWLPLFVSID